jgi:hypothetical protein
MPPGNLRRLHQSGHPWIINKLESGEPPDYPTASVCALRSYTWDDILYVVGGYSWKARFVNQEGFIITVLPALATLSS